MSRIGQLIKKVNEKGVFKYKGKICVKHHNEGIMLCDLANDSGCSKVKLEEIFAGGDYNAEITIKVKKIEKKKSKKAS